MCLERSLIVAGATVSLVGFQHFNTNKLYKTFVNECYLTVFTRKGQLLVAVHKFAFELLR